MRRIGLEDTGLGQTQVGGDEAEKVKLGLSNPLIPLCQLTIPQGAASVGPLCLYLCGREVVGNGQSCDSSLQHTSQYQV